MWKEFVYPSWSRSWQMAAISSTSSSSGDSTARALVDSTSCQHSNRRQQAGTGAGQEGPPKGRFVSARHQ